MNQFTQEFVESPRLTFVKRLYKGATLEDAADDVGMSQSTGSRWTTLWNKGGLGLLAPSFRGRPPPKLTEKQRERLLDLLEEGKPWKKQEIQNLINQEFDIEFHPNYLPRLLDDLGLSYAIPRTEKPDRPENADEILDEPLLARSPRMMETSHTTNSLKTTVTTNGRSTMVFKRTVVRPSVSSTSRTRNRGTIPSNSTQ